jgi:hypothetical protein
MVCVPQDEQYHRQRSLAGRPQQMLSVEGQSQNSREEPQQGLPPPSSVPFMRSGHGLTLMECPNSVSLSRPSTQRSRPMLFVMDVIHEHRCHG